jgi:tetratricopeptide (TPR) repeat protein
MKCSSLVLLTALFAAAPVAARAQNAPAKWADTIGTEVERAQIGGNLAAVDAAAALATRVATAYPNDGLILHYQGYAIYRQGISHMAAGQDATAYFTRAQDLLERSLKSHPLPETHMLLASIDGQLIAKDPSRAMELGMASQASSSTAMVLGPRNPRVWLLRGQGAIFTPPEYGGGLDAAEEQLQHAIELFAKDAPKAGEPNWGKAETYVWLGQVYAKKGDKAKASAAYQQALALAPGYGYAKMLAAALK